MSDEHSNVDSERSTIELDPSWNTEDDAPDEEAGGGQEQEPEDDDMLPGEIGEIMDTIRGWNAEHGLAYTMDRVLTEYGDRLNVAHIEHDPNRSAMEWYNLFTEAHLRDLDFDDTELMFHVRTFLVSLHPHPVA